MLVAVGKGMRAVNEPLPENPPVLAKGAGLHRLTCMLALKYVYVI